MTSTEGPAGLALRAAVSDADLGALAELFSTVTPDDPTTLDEIRWADRTYPGILRLLAELDGRIVGAATVGRIYIYRPDHPDFWASIVVPLPDRRRGVGTALLASVSAQARRAGKTGLQMRAWEARPEGIEFLVHRGFVELDRARMLRLELAGLLPPDVQMHAGVELTNLAERPDLVAGVHRVALETFADIPGDDPMAAGDLAEFRARDVDRPGILPGAFMVALDHETGEVVGYASLIMVPGSRTVAWHDMTAVLRAWRGRGIAIALKRATIAWAIRNGLTALETGNDEDNASMRAVNARLGYQPTPDALVMRGSLADPRGASAQH